MDHQERTQARGEATRKAILDAAARLTREMGFHRMTVRELCQAAGVTTGAFYHHFKSKEDLLSQGFLSLDVFMERAMAPYEDHSPLERLQVLLRSYAQFIEDLGWQTICLYYIRRLTDPSISTSMAPNRYTVRAMERCLADLGGEGKLPPQITSDWMADFLFRHFRGAVIDWALHEGKFSLWLRLEQDYSLFARALQQ